MAEKDQATLRVVNYASLHKSKGRGKPASLAAAKEEAITLWKYVVTRKACAHEIIQAIRAWRPEEV